MKYKTTDREQRENNALVISFGYCEIQHLERYLVANACTSGVYGWRADFYNFGGFTISTGYQPLKYILDKKDNKRYDYVKNEILKLEKKLAAHKYSFQNCGSYCKGQKFLINKLNKIYQKSLELFD